jgi:DNA polymerase lambda
VGERLANKIHEIITSGHLRRLDQVDQEKEKVITMFKGIHGVGATTAQLFYAKVCINYSQNILAVSLSYI